jgi:hypothetical protein
MNISLTLGTSLADAATGFSPAGSHPSEWRTFGLPTSH